MYKIQYTLLSLFLKGMLNCILDKTSSGTQSHNRKSFFLTQLFPIFTLHKHTHTEILGRRSFCC